MINAPRRVSKRHELREDKVVTFTTRAADFYDVHRRRVVIAAGVLGLLVLGVVAYVLWQQSREARAAELLGGVVRVYETGEHQAALDGREGQPGLLAIADDYGSTDAGNLAHFYAADALFQLGRKEEALEHFRAFDKEDDLLGAGAYAGEAAVLEDLGRFDQAAGRYAEAAEAFESDLTSPLYLLQAARAYEQAGDFDEAREMYETIREDFPESPQAGAVEMYLARLDQMTAE